jgi:hypothetical protein
MDNQARIRRPGNDMRPAATHRALRGGGSRINLSISHRDHAVYPQDARPTEAGVRDLPAAQQGNE